MGKKSPKSQTVTQETKLPPQYARGLDFVLGQGMSLANQYLGPTSPAYGATGFNPLAGSGFSPMGGGASQGDFSAPSIVPQLSGDTHRGLAGLAKSSHPLVTENLLATLRGDSMEDGMAQNILPDSAFSSLNDTAAGNYLHGGEGFNAAVDAAIRRAQPGILSTFGAAGRSGSGLAQTAMAQAASDAFASQYANERNNQMAAAGALANINTSNFNAERGRQLLAGAQHDALRSQQANDLLRSGSIREDRQREFLLEPFTRFNLATDPIIRAIGGAPTTTSTTQPLHKNTGAGLLGGALGGAGLGQALGFAGAGPLAPFAIGGALLGGIL